jgi:hypothetical protein
MAANRALSILRVVFVNNGYWKLFSLIISVLVYFSIRADISHLRTLPIPVEVDYETVPGGAAIESVEPRSVQVTLRGSYSDVNQLASTSLRCVVRPKQKKTGLTDVVEIGIGTSNLRGIHGVRVTKIEPHVAVVKFDVPMSLQLAVAPPEISGKARGRVELVYDQTNAVVNGSRRLLSPLDVSTVRVQPETIDVDGRSQSFSTTVRLYPPGDPTSVVVEPSEIVVNVHIISEKATVKMEHVPVTVLQPYAAAARWKTVPEWVDIDLTGRAEVVKAIKFGEVSASVNGNVLFALSETNEVPVMVHVWQGLSVDEVTTSPRSVLLIPLAPRTVEEKKGL